MIATDTAFLIPTWETDERRHLGSSRPLGCPQLRATIHQSVDLVCRAHSFTRQLKVGFRQLPEDFRYRGMYGLMIELRPDADVDTVIHEVGHLIDDSLRPGIGYESERVDGLLAGWREAVMSSPTWRELEQRCRPGGYWLRMDEAWARSYTQFVLTVTGRADLLDRRQPLGYWADDEFVPITREIKRILSGGRCSG
jgi:hypothetical protein